MTPRTSQTGRSGHGPTHCCPPRPSEVCGCLCAGHVSTAARVRQPWYRWVYLSIGLHHSWDVMKDRCYSGTPGYSYPRDNVCLQNTVRGNHPHPGLT